MPTISNIPRNSPSFATTETFSEAGFLGAGNQRNFNEDRILASESFGIYAVIDGTTAMRPEKIDSKTAAEYCADFVVRDLISALENKRVKIQREASREFLKLLNSNFAMHLSTNFPDYPATAGCGPSAAIIVLAMDLKLKEFNFAAVGDCGILEKRNGSWRKLNYDQFNSSTLSESETEIQRLVASLKSKGLSPNEILSNQDVQTAILESRKDYNQNSKGVLNGDPAMENCIESKTFNLDDLEYLFLATDGLKDPRESDSDNAFIAAAKQVEKIGIKNRHQEIIKLYDADPQAQLYERVKHADDASGILIKCL